MIYNGFPKIAFNKIHLEGTMPGRRIIQEHRVKSDGDRVSGFNRLLRSPVAVLLLLVASSPSLSQSSLPSPDGTRLELGEFCYTITSNEDGKDRPVGYTFESVRRGQVDGVDTLAVIVHQHLANGSFDIQDRLLLRRVDLRPIRLDTDLYGAPHAHLGYSDGRVAA
jgi:hypothetical protein